MQGSRLHRARLCPRPCSQEGFGGSMETLPGAPGSACRKDGPGVPAQHPQGSPPPMTLRPAPWWGRLSALPQGVAPHWPPRGNLLYWLFLLTSSLSAFPTPTGITTQPPQTTYISFFSLSFFFRARKTEHEPGRGRERGKDRIPSRLHTISAEPHTGLEPTNREIMTRVKVGRSTD